MTIEITQQMREEWRDGFTRACMAHRFGDPVRNMAEAGLRLLNALAETDACLDDVEGRLEQMHGEREAERLCHEQTAKERDALLGLVDLCPPDDGPCPLPGPCKDPNKDVCKECRLQWAAREAAK
jgi:hypothetical protein